MEEQVSRYCPLTVDYLLNGRYQLQQHLPQGGFSLIYMAWDHQLSKHVIVKEAAPEGIVTRDAALNIQPINEAKNTIFQRVIENGCYEAAVLRDLTARGVTHITSYIDDFMLHQTHYTVMDIAPGRDLNAWNREYHEAQVPFPADFLTSILTQMLDILAPIHEAGYYHCDIKPQNLHIDEEGRVTLLDFGAVRTAERQHDENVAISPGFSPPEFYPSHRAQIGPWTDIYMLAAMIYNLITDKVPEPADQRAVRDRQPRLSTMTALLERYPAALLNSVDKAMNVAALERYPDVPTWKEVYAGMKQATLRRAQANHAVKRGRINAKDLNKIDIKQKKPASKPNPARRPPASRQLHSQQESSAGLIFFVSALAVIALGALIYLATQG